MIFVALGTQKFQLNRLLIHIDDLVRSNQLTPEIFAQIGNSDYKPLNYQYIDFLGKEEFEEYIKNCDLLITHSGVGTIINGMKYGKKIIVFPRLKKYGEHVDDHQLQIAQSFEKQNFVLLCNDVSDLKDKIIESESYKFREFVSQRSSVIDNIRNFLKYI